ncbi:hypothetical protein AB0B85_29205 [Micromonospora sp. NPDC049044]|uniref:effector-associated constant component EACC1 n=1 Tax=unclassified Micromonospora TaxID=2617518 RepID=UPI0033C5ACEF
MNLSIRVDGDLGSDLYRWLSEDAEIPEVAVTPPTPAGAMGTGYDVLNLVVPNTIALTSLVVSILTYRDGRGRATGAAPRVEVGTADLVVVVEGEPAEVVRKLEAVRERSS